MCHACCISLETGGKWRWWKKAGRRAFSQLLSQVALPEVGCQKPHVSLPEVECHKPHAYTAACKGLSNLLIQAASGLAR